MINVGLVGLGQIALKRYIPAIAANGGVRLAGVCSRTKETCVDIADRTQCPKWATNYKELALDPSIDAIIVATPHKTHAEIALEAIRAGKHVLIEKPLATSWEDALALQAAAKESPALVMALPQDNVPIIQAVLSLIERRVLGKIVGMSVVQGGWGPPPGCDWKYNLDKSGGGVLIAHGVYGLNMIAQVMGPARKVRARVSSALTQRRMPDGAIVSSDIEDQCALMLEYDGGQQVTLESFWTLDRPHESMTVYGRDGMLFCSSGTVWLRTRDDSQWLRLSRKILGKLTGNPALTIGLRPVRTPRAKGNVVDTFELCVQRGQKPSETLEKAVHVTEQMMLAYESGQEEGTTKVLTSTFEVSSSIKKELFELGADWLR